MKGALQSYWEDELYNQQCDVLIVGAGLTGLSTALFTKRMNPDARVVVLERGVYPIGASTRNAGFACIGSITEHLADLELDSENQLKERIKARYHGLHLLRTTLGEQNIEYDDCGGWEIFTEYTEFEKASEQVARFNGWMEQLIGEKEVYQVGKFEGYPAIFNRVEGALHPGKMMITLIELNVNEGVELRWQTAVKHIDVEKGSVIGENGEQWISETLVLTTNAFTNHLSQKKEIKPGRGFVFVTSPIKELPWKGTFHYDKGYVYFRNLGEDRLLIGGGRNVDYDAETTDKFGINESIKEYLINYVNDVIKLPKGWQIEREWSGIMGFTESKSPSLEKIGTKTWQVAGLSGMGVALGMALGKSAAEKL